MKLIALHHADDAVIAEFDLLGTHLGTLRGLPPTGRPFRCRMAAPFLFEEALNHPVTIGGAFLRRVRGRI